VIVHISTELTKEKEERTKEEKEKATAATESYTSFSPIKGVPYQQEQW